MRINPDVLSIIYDGWGALPSAASRADPKVPARDPRSHELAVFLGENFGIALQQTEHDFGRTTWFHAPVI
jgi:hypothetical protein